MQTEKNKVLPNNSLKSKQIEALNAVEMFAIGNDLGEKQPYQRCT